MYYKSVFLSYLPIFIHSIKRYPFNTLKKNNKFIYLYLAALGLYSCAWAFSSSGGRGLLFIAVRRLLIAVASPVVEHRF